jgi:hypothetical protein
LYSLDVYDFIFAQTGAGKKLRLIMAESPQKSPQFSDPESDGYGTEKNIGYVTETPTYATDEKLGENEEYGEVKELR